MEITLQLRWIMVCQFSVSSFSTSKSHFKWFPYNGIAFMTLGLRYFVLRLHYVWEQRCNHVSVLFVIVT